ncbi:MAG: NAD-dependent epimerase/dehydratase family protein [Halobacteriaceae archaeon]
MSSTETVVVTGARGRFGSRTAASLAEAGHDVVAVDLTAPDETYENITFHAVDLTDEERTRGVIADADPAHVVHLGAIPSPNRGDNVYENNSISAYYVLDEAGKVGADVVQASSESAYGFPFAAEPRLPDYLPIDEAHPMRPEDPYGVSKVVAEELGAMVARRYGISVASFRLSNIMYPGNYTVLDGRGDLSNGVGNFWSYVDGRDCVSAVEAAMEADIEGHEPYIIAAAENHLDRPTREAFEEFFGEVPEPCDLTGEESALSVAKARAELDWEPEHTWRTAAEEEFSEPPFAAD